MLISTGKIRALNNALRMTMTAGIDTLPSRVATFSDFSEDNDPRGKHAFGSFILAGRKFIFKLDCYDSNMEFGSEDPADPSKTIRVLAIMLAEEY